MANQSTDKSKSAGYSISSFIAIFLPLIMIFFIVILLGVLLFNQNNSNSLFFDNWLNISIIVISFFLLIPSVFLFLFIIVLILLLGKTQNILFPFLNKIQIINIKVSKLILDSAQIIHLPFSSLAFFKKHLRNNEDEFEKEEIHG